MPYLMHTETWLKLTELTGKPRSKYLKAVDEALRQYHAAHTDANLSKVKLALHHWKMSKGYDVAAGKPAWMLSPRNRNRAAETLDLQTFGMNSACPPGLVELADTPFYGIEAWAGEMAARQAMKDARQQALQEMFQGKKVTVKKKDVAIMVEFMKRNLAAATADGSKAAAAAASYGTKRAEQAAKQAAQPLIDQARAAAQQLINEILAPFPVAVAQEVMQFLSEIIPQFLVELAGAIAPYLGVATSGIKAIVYTGKTIAAQYKRETSEEHKVAFGKGDPFAALLAIQRMIERERNRCALIASANAADAAVKAAAHIADAAAFGAPTVSAVVSPLSGMAKSLAMLGQQIYLLARDIQERQAANKILAGTPKLTAELFETCPLLGCYFVAGSTTSNLINFAVEDIGAVGWNLDAEQMIRQHIHPMISMAREVIGDSRLEVAGMELSKAASAKTTAGAHGVSNLKDRVKKKVIDKLNEVLPFRETIHKAPTPLQPTAVKMGFQPMKPTLAQQRIYGNGPR